MGGSTHITFTAGAVVFAGGMYAFIAKKSKASLIASSVIAGGLILGGVITRNGNDLLGHQISLASSASLASFGLYRLISTKKPFPSLPLLILGGATAAYEAKKMIEWM
jgi:uncharacterized membrane protein (UPF0136 family)